MSSFCPGSKVGAATITSTGLETAGHTFCHIVVDQPVEHSALAESPVVELSNNFAGQANLDFLPVNSFYDPTFNAQPTDPTYDARFDAQSTGPLYDPRFNIQSMDPLYDPCFNIQSTDRLYDPHFNIQLMNPLSHLQPVTDLRVTASSEHIDRPSYMQQKEGIDIFQKSRLTIDSQSSNRSTIRSPSSPYDFTFLLNSAQLNQTQNCSI
jgi:hypothetical protein